MEFYYEVDNQVSLEDILQIRSICKDSFGQLGGGSDFSPDDLQFGSLTMKGKLAALPRVKGMTFIVSFISGYLPAKANSLDDLFNVLENVKILIWFELKAEYGLKSRGENLELVIRKGAKLLDYTSSLLIASDRKNYFDKFFKALEIPIALMEESSDYYFNPTTEGFFSISGAGPKKTETGLRGDNATSFRVEISDNSYRGMKSKLRMLLDTFGTGKVTQYSWTIYIDEKDPDKNAGLYELAVKKSFPARKCEVDFSYQLTGIEGIEGLKNICTKKSEFLTTLCSFDLPGQDSATFEITTRADGHHLSLRTSASTDPDNIKLIERKLGIKFKEPRE